MMKYKGTELTIPEIANELGVSTILEGGVQRAGKRIRINAQLIDVSNDQHLWAETFDREMTMENIFDIQSEITRQIVSAVRGELTDAEAEAINQLPTSNLQAYEAHMKARAFTNHANYAKESFISAEPWAELAVELDPQFAQAWSELAAIHGMAIWIGYDTSPQRHQAMKTAVEMATLLAPDQPWTLLAQAEYSYRIERDYSSSLAVLRKAHEALPGDSEILEHMALSQRRLGLWEESVNSALQAVLLDPGNISSARLAIETLGNMGEWSRVISLATEWAKKFDSTDMDVELAFAFTAGSGDLGRSRRLLDHITPVASETYANFATLLPLLERDYQAMIEIWDQPEVKAMTEQDGWTGWRQAHRGFAYLKMGKPKKAEAQFKQGLELLANISASNSSAYAYDLEALAFNHALLGENDKAFEASLKAKQHMPESLDRMDGTSISAQHVQILGMTGHRDEALAEIERLLDLPNGLVRWNLYLDPMWDYFRDDERFNELIKPRNLDEAQK
jgi:tetratricopeptide (TPR) repeat protein